MKTLTSALLFAFCIPAFAADPVIPIPASEQAALLESSDSLLAANKKVAFEMYRIAIAAQWDLLDTVVSPTFINHDPNEKSGLEGLKSSLARSGRPPQPLPDTLPGLVTIFAEGDMVVMAFAREYDHPTVPGEKYSTTWFDMFRIKNGLVVELWDAAKISEESN